MAGLPDQSPVKCSRGVVIVPDISLSDVESTGPYDAMVLPGGLGGAKALAESNLVGKILKNQEASGRIVAAICAGRTNICRCLKLHLGIPSTHRTENARNRPGKERDFLSVC